MTDLEFDVLDELYFVKSFVELQDALEMNQDELKETLIQMGDKKWVGCYATPMIGVTVEKKDFQKNYEEYFYLATKKGMLAHNGL